MTNPSYNFISHSRPGSNESATTRERRTHIHQQDSDGETDAEVVAVGFVNRQEGPREQEENAA